MALTPMAKFTVIIPLAALYTVLELTRNVGPCNKFSVKYQDIAAGVRSKTERLKTKPLCRALVAHT